MLEKIDLSKKMDKDTYKQVIGEQSERLGLLQRELRTAGIPVMIVFEGMGAAGKGTQINRLIQAMDPRGFEVFANSKATEEEQLRPFLWRFWTKTPADGRIAIFDRSWYRQVTIERFDGQIKEKNLPQSQEDAIALLNDIQENAFSQVEYKKDSTNGTELYYYAASTQDADLGYVYLIKYLINTDTESYTITAKLTSSDSTVQQAVKSAVTSFKVLNDDSKKTDSGANSGSSADGSTSSDNAGNSSDPENTGDTASDNTSGESTGDSSGASTDEEYRYFFDANGNTIYAYPSEDGSWRDDNGTSYIFLENGVEDSNGTQYYYDPPQGTTGSGSESDSLTGSGNSSDNGMVIGFYDINGNYQTATQDANGNWIGSDGKTYTFDEKGATDSDGNFSKW